MSGQLKEVRNRIKSVTSTQQITKAMKMVSAAKLKRAQDAITTMRPYANKLKEILEPLDKWETVLKVDGIALRNILGVLPIEAREEIEKARIIDKETKTFSVRKK